MTPEHRRLIDRIRSSAEVIRRAVEEAPRGRFDVLQSLRSSFRRVII